jgi:hypothetical protein
VWAELHGAGLQVDDKREHVFTKNYLVGNNKITKIIEFPGAYSKWSSAGQISKV